MGRGLGIAGRRRRSILVRQAMWMGRLHNGEGVGVPPAGLDPPPSAFLVYAVNFFTFKLLVEMMMAFKLILIDAVCLGIPAPWGF